MIETKDRVLIANIYNKGEVELYIYYYKTDNGDVYVLENKDGCIEIPKSTFGELFKVLINQYDLS